MEDSNELLELTPSVEFGSHGSIQTMIINHESNSKDESDTKQAIKFGSIDTEELWVDSKARTQPVRHISALNYIDKDQKHIYESSVSLENSNMNYATNENGEPNHEIVYDGSSMSNWIKIRQNTDAHTKTLKTGSESSTSSVVIHTNIAPGQYDASTHFRNDSKVFDFQTSHNTDIMKDIGHHKSDTFIWHNTIESQKYHLESVLKAWINGEAKSDDNQSSFLYKTENSTNFDNSSKPRPENVVRTHREKSVNLVKLEREFSKEKDALQQKLINSESQQQELSEQITKLK